MNCGQSLKFRLVLSTLVQVQVQVHKYKYTSTSTLVQVQVQVHKYEYRRFKYKYKYTSTSTQVQVLWFKYKYFSCNSQVHVVHYQTPLISDKFVTVYNQIKIISQTRSEFIYTVSQNKKLCCRKEAARCFVSV